MLYIEMFRPFQTAKSLTVSSSPRYIVIKAFVEKLSFLEVSFFKQVHHVSTGPGHENELFLPRHQILQIHSSVLHTDFISYISYNLITAAQDWQLDPSKNIWAVFWQWMAISQLQKKYNEFHFQFSLSQFKANMSPWIVLSLKRGLHKRQCLSYARDG